MASQLNLMGLGMTGPLAERLGYNPLGLTATGTSSITAAKINSKMQLVTSATSQTGAILPSNPGDIWFISCAHGSTASAVIYPAAGATITNGASVTLAADKNMIVWQYSATLYFHLILV